MKTIELLEKEDVISFLKTYPAIKRNILADEASVNRVVLWGIVSGDYKISLKISSKLIPVMEKYGWKNESPPISRLQTEGDASCFSLTY